MIIDKSRPIWRQIVREVKERIARGDIEKEAPTVRSLAEELSVNPNTVGRAYRAMEREGILGSRVGRGTWIKKGAKKKLQKNMRQGIVNEFVDRLTSIGLSLEEIKKLVEEIND